MNTNLKLAVLMMAAMIIFSSCASIVSSSTYPLSIKTDPSEATVSITDSKGQEIFRGTTPANVNLKAGAGFFIKAEYQVKLSRAGYDDKIVPVTCTLDGWYFGNILIGGLLGMLIIDPATGAMWRIEQGFINETLNSSLVTTDPGMQILNIHQIPESWKEHLVEVE